MMLTSTLAAAEPLRVKWKKNVIKKTPHTNNMNWAPLRLSFHYFHYYFAHKQTNVEYLFKYIPGF